MSPKMRGGPKMSDDRNLLTRVSAWFVSPGAAKAADRDRPFAGQIVVIGSSGVLHAHPQATPLGLMPAPMILLNSIHSLLQYGRPRAGRPMDQVLTIGLVLGFSLALFSMRDRLESTIKRRYPADESSGYLSRMASAVLMGVSSRAVILLLLVASIIPFGVLFLEWGIWTSFAAPCAAVAIYEATKARDDGSTQ